jgi:hypothetical protein
MSKSRISIPAHHLDPIKKNPAPPGHPAHDAWEAATLAAEGELFDFQASMLQIPTHTDREFGEWYLRLSFQTFQIWAKRYLCIVRYADIRAFEKWLESYRKNYLRGARRHLTKTIVEGPDLVKELMIELRVQLLRAARYWTAAAIDQVSKANQKNPSEAPQDAVLVIPVPQPPTEGAKVHSARRPRKQEIKGFMGELDIKTMPDAAKVLSVGIDTLKSIARGGDRHSDDTEKCVLNKMAELRAEFRANKNKPRP